MEKVKLFTSYRTPVTLTRAQLQDSSLTRKSSKRTRHLLTPLSINAISETLLGAALKHPYHDSDTCGLYA